MSSSKHRLTQDSIRTGVISIVSDKRKTVGAGFFVSEKIAITCAHVVRAAKSDKGFPVWVKLHDGTLLQAKVSTEFWAEINKEDVAVLEFTESLPISVKPLRVGPSENIRGQRFIVYGFPENVPGGMWGYGDINDDIDRDEEGILLKQLTSGEITNGFSGSPVFNEKTQCVVGMVTERTRADLEEVDKRTKQLAPSGRLTKTAFATPSSVLKRIFPQLNFEPICPYLDLAAFTAEDSEFFYGRDKLIDILVEKVQTYPSFLAVTGASGSGKSSVVQAKLLPKIQRGEVLGFDVDTPIVNFRPSQAHTPEAALFLAFQKVGGFNQKIGADWNIIKNYIQKAKKRVVIFIDQFEELFSDQCHLQESNSFLNKLSNLLDRSPQLSLILTMRTEFDPRLESSPLGKRLTQGSIVIRGVASEHLNLKEAIVGPADSVGLNVEPGLVAAIIHDLDNTESPLPLLEFTLTELWKRNHVANLISYDTYESIGKVKGALLQWATKFYEYELSPDVTYKPRSESQKALLRRILGRLVQFGSNDVPDIRYRASLKDLKDLGETAAILLNQMTDARLLVKDEDTGELVHDSLIKEWLKQGELGRWFEEQRQFLLWRQRFDQDINEWEEDSEKLLYQPYLGTAIRWLETHKDELTKVEQDYIQRSKRRENRRRNTSIAVLNTGLAVVSIALILALFQWNRATDREKTAQSIQQATIAEANLDTDTTKSLALALRAVQIQETSEAALALGKAFYANHERAYFKHINPVTYGEFAPGDSDQFFTVSSDGKLRIWKVTDSSKPVCILGEEKPNINYARFHPQNEYQVLTINNDSTASLWNVETCQLIQLFKGHTAPISYGAFDPNNPKRIITASSDGTARVWDINKPEKPTYILEHNREVWKAEFNSVDPNRVLTVGADGTVKIWDLSHGKISATLKANQGQILNATFDQINPNRLITVSDDKTAQIWDLNNIDKPTILGSHSSPVILGVISPENTNQAITVTKDGSVKLWNIKQPDQPKALISSITKASYATFNPANKDQLLILGSNGTGGRAEVWSISKLSIEYELIGHKSEISYGMFSPGENGLVLTIGNDETARIWDIQPKSIFRTERSKHGIIVAATFLEKQQDSLMSINKDGLVEQWNISSGTLLNSFRLSVSPDSITNADFNPKNYQELVTVNSRGDVNLWNLNAPDKSLHIPLKNDSALRISYSRKNSDQVMVVTERGVITVHSISNLNGEPLVLSKLPARIISGQFSPHSKDEIITASEDGALSIWNLANTSSPKLEKRYANDLFWFVGYHALKPNIVFAGGERRRVWIWELSQNNPPLELEGHAGIVTSGSMNSQQENKIVTSARDGSVNIWDSEYLNEPLSIKEPNVEVIFTIFNPNNSEQILTLTSSGVLSLYNIDGQKLFDQAIDSLSRCLSPPDKNVFPFRRSPFNMFVLNDNC